MEIINNNIYLCLLFSNISIEMHNNINRGLWNEFQNYLSTMDELPVHDGFAYFDGIELLEKFMNRAFDKLLKAWGDNKR